MIKKRNKQIKMAAKCSRIKYRRKKLEENRNKTRNFDFNLQYRKTTRNALINSPQQQQNVQNWASIEDGVGKNRGMA